MSNVNQKALSALKLLSNVAVFQDTMYSVSSLDKSTRPVELASMGTLLKSKVQKALAMVPEINKLATEQGLPTEMVSEYVRIANTFVNKMNEAKMGSLNFSQYTVTAYGSGIRINKVGAKTGMKVCVSDKVSMKIEKDTFISEFISYRNFTMNVYTSVMDRILVVKQEDGSWEEVVFNDFFLKLVLVQHANVVLDTLLTNDNTVLVLSFNDGLLNVIPHPLLEQDILDILEENYGEYASNYTAPSKANEGYVELHSNLKNMIQKDSEGTLHSFLDPKKAVARQEKLNGDTAVARIKTRVFLVTKSSDKSLPYFNTGCFYASSKLLMSIGCCRVTSDFQNLLIKGVTHYAPWIAGEFGNTISICASSSAKGGLASLAENMGKGFVFESMEEIPSIEVQTITLNNGDVVEGVYADVILKITNAFTAEMFTRYTEETSVSSLVEAEAALVAEQATRLLSFNKKETAALSMEIMKACRTYRSNIVDTICKMEEEKLISLKPAVTTLTQGEFENIALSFGDDVALDYMNTVVGNRFNSKADFVTKAGKEWLLGTPSNTATKMAYESMSEIFAVTAAEYGVSVEDNVVESLSTSFLRTLMSNLGLQSEDLAWIFVPELNAYIPTGEALYGKLFSASNDFELEFEMGTALKYVVSTLAYLKKVSDAGHMNKGALLKSGLNLQLFIQDSILNKKVSKMKVHGKYMTLLPGFWLENVHDVCLLSRDLYQPEFSHLKWTKVNMAKHPVLFLEAVAGFKCYKEIPGVEVDDTLCAIYANTIFVHPDYLLQLQNDCDGDLARISFDSYWLPLYTGKALKACMSSFHQDYMDGENDLGINLTKLPKHTTFFHSDLYEAIEASSTAKMNVALFTDNLHKVMCTYRSSVLTEKLVNANGEVGMDMVKDALIVIASMVQTDAMNAIKHSGGVTAGASLCSTEIGKEGGYEIAKKAVLEYLETYNVQCKDKKAFAAVVATLCLYTHSVALNNTEMLTNQYERLVFKNQPKELFKYTDLDGNEKVGSRRLNLFGKFANSWNITGQYSMFSEYLECFYGREM